MSAEGPDEIVPGSSPCFHMFAILEFDMPCSAQAFSSVDSTNSPLEQSL